MTDDELIDGILEREGGFTNDPDDRGDPTSFGINAAAWGSYRGLDFTAVVFAVAIAFTLLTSSASGQNASPPPPPIPIDSALVATTVDSLGAVIKRRFSIPNWQTRLTPRCGSRSPRASTPWPPPPRC